MKNSRSLISSSSLIVVSFKLVTSLCECPYSSPVSGNSEFIREPGIGLHSFQV